MVQLTPSGQQITLRMMTPGQTFGGIAMLNPKAGYPATAQAGESFFWKTFTNTDRTENFTKTNFEKSYDERVVLYQKEQP